MKFQKLNVQCQDPWCCTQVVNRGFDKIQRVTVWATGRDRSEANSEVIVGLVKPRDMGDGIDEMKRMFAATDFKGRGRGGYPSTVMWKQLAPWAFTPYCWIPLCARPR